MAELFIERRFEVGDTAAVVARWFRSVQRDVDFRCDYEIVWPDRTRTFVAYGIDEVQALILALKMVHVGLLTSPEGRRGALRWLGSKDLDLPSI